MAANNQKNTRILLFLLLCIRMTLTVDANDFLFTSINTAQGLSDNQIRYILQLPDGRMVFTTNGNVNLYDGVHFSYLHRTAEDVSPLKQYEGCYRIYQCGDSLLWIKDYHKLMCIDLHQEKYIPHLDSYFRRKEIHEPVEDLFVDNSGRIWLLTSQELRELETGIRLALPENEHRQLQDIHSDELAVYLFYHTGEVVCYDPKTGKQLYDRAAYPASEQENFNRTSLVVKSKKGFYQLRNGRKGGFFYFNPQNRTWEKLFEQNYTLNTLIITPQGDKAYISCVHGFWIIDLESREQQYIPVLETKKGQLVSTEVSTIFQDAQGGLWVGTLNRGLLYHHPATHKLIHVSRTAFPASPEEDVAVKAFAEDDNGNIYLKSHSTIYQLAVDQDGSRTLLPVPASSVSAELAKELDQRGGNKYYRGQSYTALCTDTRGWTWAGTADGLELFTDQEQTPDSKPTTQTADNQSASPNKQAHRIFYRENGLSNNFVQSIIEDRNNYIWVTTSNGISRIHINQENQEIGFTNFNQLDGALEEEYIQGAIFESSDGTLYFGGIDGFTIFRPDHESATPGLPYKPVFTNLHLYGEKVNTGEKYGNRIILPQAAPYTKELELDYNQNFLTFECSALNYVNSERTYYRYQLEGIDKQWMNAFASGQGNATVGNGILQASYTNLPPGEYTFKVAASDNQLQWNDNITKIHVIIHAPWWKTTTAYVLYTIIVLLIVLASIRLYIYQTKKKMKQQHKEEILLLRIRNLIEQCNSYEAEQKARSEKKSHPSVCDRNETADDNEKPNGIEPDSAESAFLVQAIELVEKNLDVNGYSVEQLSRDLCMERTGLYRKLVTLLDQSPSLFIRNIRLQRAAQLLAEGKLSVTEIAERTGFSSSSYLSKCFQEMYGCRPSEYTEKAKRMGQEENRAKAGQAENEKPHEKAKEEKEMKKST